MGTARRQDEHTLPAPFAGRPSEHATATELNAASLTRRSFIGAGAAALAGVPRGASAAGAKVPFGGAIMSDYLDSDPAYVKAFLDHCDLVMPMNELKADILRPDAASFNFEPADRIVDLALSNGLTTRGHALVWFGATPPWMEAIKDADALERALGQHIETVVGRYAGRMTSWDVVNEAIAFEPTGTEFLRDTSWLRTMGPRHISVAFQAAERADPKARLVLNDYDLEFAGPRYDLRREIALSIVRQLQDARIRIDAIGIQGHLYAEQRIDVEALARFGEALKRLGVRLLVTELDVIDWKVEGGPEAQDAAALKIVGDLLDGVFAAGPPEAVIAWGITDRYSWIPGVMPRPDGTPNRPLPLDADLVPKSWYGLIRRRLSREA